MGTHTDAVQTPSQILEGLHEVFGRRAVNCPVMRPEEQIDAMTGVIRNIAMLASAHPEMGESCAKTLRHCAANPVLKQEGMQPVVAAINARLELSF